MNQPVDEWGVIGDDKPAANGPQLVKLVDGREVSTWSECWRKECEARWLLSLPLEHRRDVLYGAWVDVFTPGQPRTQVRKGGIAQKRGEATVKEIERVMMAVWKSRKARRKAARHHVTIFRGLAGLIH